MKFQIKLPLMKDYLKKLSASVHSVASRVELTGILISVFDNSIVFEGRNDNIDIKIEETSLSEVRIFETGRALIKANMLNEIIQRMEGDTVTFTKIDSNIVTIEAAGSKYDMNLLTDENFEKASYMDEVDESFTIKATDFSNSVSKVVFAGNEWHSKFIYQGVHFSINENVLSTTVCDGIRIASVKKNINFDGILNKIIPITVVRELNKLLPTSGEYKFSFKNNKGIVKTDNIVIQFAIIEGTFPSFDKLYDKSLYNSSLVIDKLLLAKSLDRVTVFSLSTFNSSRVIINLKQDELKLESGEIEIGTADVVINDFNYSGEELKIALSPKIITEVLKVSSSENVSLYFKDNKSTILLISEKDQLTYLMSPMV